jgi:hypothetical protein
MNRYLQQFLTQYPKANVRLEYQHPHRVYEAVEKDQADIGLLSYPRASRTIEAIGWREEPMVLVCSPSHRLAGRRSVAFDELAGENFIGFDSDLTIRREIDRVLESHDVEVRMVMEFDNIETMKRAVEIDAGVSFLPEPSVAREVTAGTLVAVPLAADSLVRPLGIVYRRGKELSSTTRRFIALLQANGQAALATAEHGVAERSVPDQGVADRSVAESSDSGTPRAAAEAQGAIANRTDANGANGNGAHGNGRTTRAGSAAGGNGGSGQASGGNGHPVAAGVAQQDERPSSSTSPARVRAK